MSIIVQKFGGSSVGSLERIHLLAKKIKAARDQGHDVLVIVSAMYGETDRLIQLTHALVSTPVPREYDALIATGEQISSALLSMALNAIDCPAQSFNGAQAGIVTDDVHTKARILEVKTEALVNTLKKGVVPIITGFQGTTETGAITTLGRGGSDTSAVAIAIALNASECQIFTDVNGVYTTDPHFFPEAKLIPMISFQEMLEMASLGAKVLQIRSVELAAKHNMPIRVLSSFVEGEGTLVTREELIVDKRTISGITFSKEEMLIALDHLPREAHVETRILEWISDQHIEIDMISHRFPHEPEGSFLFSASRKDLPAITKLLEQITHDHPEITTTVQPKLAKLSFIGIGMRSHSSIASQLYQLFKQSNIRPQMITTSEIRLSVLLEESVLEKAISLTHSVFISNNLSCDLENS